MGFVQTYEYFLAEFICLAPIAYIDIEYKMINIRLFALFATVVWDISFSC